MVTYIIKVTEVRGRGVMIDVKPNEADATAKEKETADIIDHLMQPIFELLASSGGQPKTVGDKDLEATRMLVEKRAKRFLRS